MTGPNPPLYGAALVRLAGLTRWLPAALGAGLAIALTSYGASAVMPDSSALPWLVASMGASAVLVFVLPASPLSQPWPVAGGHLVAAAMGLVMRQTVPDLWLAAGLAVGLSIIAMSLARCLHPPAGGTALITVLSGTGGWMFLVFPLGLNLVLLLGCGLVWNRLTGHSYPHRPAPIPAPAAWVGHIEDADLDAVLDQWDEVLDINREDLLALLHAAEMRVLERVRGN
ncbi:MAG: HPP family protein [Novosphingobium sp.]